MRIAVLNWRDTGHPRAGGAEVVVDRQASGLAERNHDVTLFTSGYVGASSESDDKPYKIRRIGGRFTVYYQVMRALSAPREAHQYDVILEHINGVPWYAPLWARVPVAGYLYHPVSSIFFRELPFPIAAAGLLSERSIPYFYHKVPFGCLGAAARSDFCSIGFDEESIKLVPPGVDHTIYRPTETKTPSPSIVMVGPIKAYKRLDLAVRALALITRSIPDIHLTILGEDSGNLTPQLKQLSERLGVRRNVSFLGLVSENDKVAHLSRSWCLVYASDREGWGLGVTEAAACGTPSVTSRVGGLKDSVVEGVTGLHFEPGDVTGLAAKLCPLLSDENLRRRLSRNAFDYATRLSWTDHVAGIDAILQSATGTHRRD